MTKYSKKVYRNSNDLTPLTPFFNLSSINSERYSGDLQFKLIKCSKSLEIIFLNKLSLLNDS